MHDLTIDFETVTPDIWNANEEAWKKRLLELPNWYQVRAMRQSFLSGRLPHDLYLTFQSLYSTFHITQFES